MVYPVQKTSPYRMALGLYFISNLDLLIPVFVVRMTKQTFLVIANLFMHLVVFIKLFITCTVYFFLVCVPWELMCSMRVLRDAHILSQRNTMCTQKTYYATFAKSVQYKTKA